MDYIDHFKLKHVYGDRYFQRHLHLFKSVLEKLFLRAFIENWKELDCKGILFYVYNIMRYSNIVDIYIYLLKKMFKKML